MIVPMSKTVQPAPSSFVVRRGKDRIKLSYEHLFALGREYWVAGEYKRAQAIFELLTTVTDRGPRAHVLLAHCHVMQNRFAQCSITLTEALANGPFEDASIDLHDAFVFWRVGLWSDVVRVLKKVIKEYPELPSPNLLLADVLWKTSRNGDALRYLRQAIMVDRRGGEIAMIARRDLAAKA